MSKNTFKLEIAGITKELSINIEDPALQFIARFERLDTYSGEFGFDWMRDNYKNDCLDYESLKSEYTPEEIHGEEYFVPWLSLMPEQKDVKLKLLITEKVGAVKDSDIIKFPAKDGISFEPDSLKVSEANEKEITVTCGSALSSNTVIDFLDKNDAVVGKLNVFKNNEILNLPIRIIKVIDGGENQSINGKIFDESITNATLNEVKDVLLNKGLNQALIKPVFEDADYASIKELKFDMKKLAEEGLVEYVSETSTHPHYVAGKKDELRDLFVQKQNELFGEYKGVIAFTTIIHSEGLEGGFSWVIPRDNNVVMMPDGGFRAFTYLHEIGHSLGLEHPFSEKDEHQKNIEICEGNIKIYEDNNAIFKSNIDVYNGNIKSREAFLAKYKSRSASEIINFTGGDKKTVKKIREEGLATIKEQKELRAEAQKSIEENNKKIEETKKDIVDYQVVSNKYEFKQATTDNVMDYGQDKTLVIRNPHTMKNVFHKYQWLLMREGVKIIT